MFCTLFLLSISLTGTVRATNDFECLKLCTNMPVYPVCPTLILRTEKRLPRAFKCDAKGSSASWHMWWAEEESVLITAINPVCYGSDTKGHLVYICEMPVGSKMTVFHILRKRTGWAGTYQLITYPQHYQNFFMCMPIFVLFLDFWLLWKAFALRQHHGFTLSVLVWSGTVLRGTNRTKTDF